MKLNNELCPTYQPIVKDFYLRKDNLLISKELLGKALYSRDSNGIITGGIICETESYQGPIDKASHAYNNRKTKRTEVMFEQGSLAYVYLCYGIHYLLNVVTHRKGIPHATLIRSIIPCFGKETMLQRRNFKKPLSKGPGTLCQAMGISKKDNGCSFLGNRIWIEDQRINFTSAEIAQAPRIGIAYAQEHALLPWRFTLKSESIEKTANL